MQKKRIWTTSVKASNGPYKGWFFKNLIINLSGALYEGWSSKIALKLLEAIVGEFVGLELRDPEGLAGFFDTLDFTIVDFEKA